jgi:hypothetical protein
MCMSTKKYVLCETKKIHVSGYINFETTGFSSIIIHHHCVSLLCVCVCVCRGGRLCFDAVQVQTENPCS